MSTSAATSSPSWTAPESAIAPFCPGLRSLHLLFGTATSECLGCYQDTSLHLDHLAVQTAGAHEFFVRAALDDAPSVEDQDLIHLLHPQIGRASCRERV